MGTLALLTAVQPGQWSCSTALSGFNSLFGDQADAVEGMLNCHALNFTSLWSRGGMLGLAEWQ
jgi:hypothetical protein